MSSIVEAVRDYIKTYTELAHGAPVWVDYLGPEFTEYSVVPLAGDKVIEAYINGDSLRAYPFAFRSVESTIDQLAKIENLGFYEEFADWLESQTYAGILPVLGSDKIAEEISALGWSYLMIEGESNTGIYQVQCQLVYTQKEITQ